MADDMVTSRKIAENVILTVVSRISMALAIPVICALFWLYNGWQDDKLTAIRTQVATVQLSAKDASEKASKLSDRLISVETKQVQDAASSDKFQQATLTRLDRVQDSLVGLSNAVAALTATIQAIESEKRNGKPP
jgi:hypothetical protein